MSKPPGIPIFTLTNIKLDREQSSGSKQHYFKTPQTRLPFCLATLQSRGLVTLHNSDSKARNGQNSVMHANLRLVSISDRGFPQASSHGGTPNWSSATPHPLFRVPRLSLPRTLEQTDIASLQRSMNTRVANFSRQKITICESPDQTDSHRQGRHVPHSPSLIQPAHQPH